MILTSGIDQGSKVRLKDAIAAAQKADAVCYVVVFFRTIFGEPANELAERALTAAPAAAQIDDTLGWILLAQGETDKAVARLSAANSAAPRNPDIQYHLAVALQRVGRRADAQAMLEALLGSGVSFADKAEAEKLLQELKHS